MKIADFLSRVTMSEDCVVEPTRKTLILALEGDNGQEQPKMVDIADILKCQS